MPAQWSDDYLIGIDSVDEQHKQIFAMVDRFYQDCLKSAGETTVDETLKFLEDYARNHFKHEETLMREYKYPRLDEHLKLHQAFLRKYSEFMEDRGTFGPSQELADSVSEMVQNWLIDHIAQADRDYAAHIKAGT
jgi:hemerythrin